MNELDHIETWDIPSSWCYAKLEDIGSGENAIVDGPFGSNLKVSDYIEDSINGVPVLTTKNLEGDYSKNSVRYISQNKFEELKRSKVQPGDILVAKIGSIGKTGIYPVGMKTAIIPANLLKFTVADSVEFKYVFSYLNYLGFQKFIRLISTATAQPAFNVTKFRKLPLPLPPLDEQHRIVAKIEELFSELDKGIENLKTAREQLKVYRQALLKHAFEGKLTAQWRAERRATKSVAPAKAGAQPLNSMDSRLRGNDEGGSGGDERGGVDDEPLETADALLARIQTEREQRYQQQLQQWQTTGGSLVPRAGKPKAPKPLPPLTAAELAKLPELPEGWGWFKVAHVCDVVRGGSPRPAGDPKFYGGSIPFLKVADITTTATPYLSTYTYTITEAGLSKTRQIEPNTLLLSNSGATLGVPKICLISATMNDGVAAFLGLPHEALLYHYYFWQSKTERLRNIDQGAAQPNLNTDLIKETFIPICSQAEQVAVAQKLEEALSEVEQLDQTLTTSLQQAEALRQSILKKAFSGQLVAQDADDEPAAALLARIRAERAVGAKTTPTAAKLRKGMRIVGE